MNYCMTMIPVGYGYNFGIGHLLLKAFLYYIDLGNFERRL